MHVLIVFLWNWLLLISFGVMILCVIQAFMNGIGLLTNIQMPYFVLDYISSNHVAYSLAFLLICSFFKITAIGNKLTIYILKLSSPTIEEGQHLDILARNVVDKIYNRYGVKVKYHFLLSTEVLPVPLLLGRYHIVFSRELLAVDDKQLQAHIAYALLRVYFGDPVRLALMDGANICTYIIKQSIFCFFWMIRCVCWIMRINPIISKAECALMYLIEYIEFILHKLVKHGQAKEVKRVDELVNLFGYGDGMQDYLKTTRWLESDLINKGHRHIVLQPSAQSRLDRFTKLAKS